MISLRAGNVRLDFQFGFFMTSALFCLIDSFDTALLVLCACIIHEIGHIAAAVLCNVKIERVTFGLCGIKMQSEAKITALSKEIFILLSGPAVNLLAALFYFYMEMYIPFSVNLIIGLFNLLTFSNLDGGTIIKKIFEHAEINTYLFMRILAVLTGFFLCMFFAVFSISNFMIYAVIIFFTVCEFFY